MACSPINITENNYEEYLKIRKPVKHCLTCEYEPKWGEHPFDADHGSCNWPCPPCLTRMLQPVNKNKLFACPVWVPNSLCGSSPFVSYEVLFDDAPITIQNCTENEELPSPNSFSSLYQVKNFIKFCTREKLLALGSDVYATGLDPDDFIIDKPGKYDDVEVVDGMNRHPFFPKLEVVSSYVTTSYFGASGDN